MVGGLQNGADEVLNLGAVALSLNADAIFEDILIGGQLVNVDYDFDTLTLTITEGGPG